MKTVKLYNDCTQTDVPPLIINNQYTLTIASKSTAINQTLTNVTIEELPSYPKPKMKGFTGHKPHYKFHK